MVIGADPELRYERKLVAEAIGPAEVRRLLGRHPALFLVAYPPRWVNGIYFDTPLRADYWDNAEGNPDRSKARIRWYGDLMGRVSDPVLEIKSKAGLIGGKRRFPLPALDIDHLTCARTLRPILRRGAPEELRGILGGLEPTCAIRYHRDYYHSADGRFRATIDADVVAVAVGRLRARWHHRVQDRDRVVVEIKYDRDHDGDAHRICSWFPFRQSRNSKYARALELLAL
jgi:hypothetical protein